MMSLNCESCGAAIIQLDRSGRYICDYCLCQAVIRPLADSADRLVLTGSESQHACPSCPHQLLEAGSLDAAPVLGCRRCQGILMPRNSFARLVSDRRAEYRGPERAPTIVKNADVPRADHDRLVCPTCHRSMDSFFYAGPGRVAIGTCQHCDAVWLDCGELTRIEVAPGVR